MLKLKQLKAAKRQTRRKELFSGTALVFLLLSASWQGIVNTPIDQASWSLPKYVGIL